MPDPSNVVLSAIDIKKLYYCAPAKVTGDLTAAMLKTILADQATKEVKNVHQDTWNIEEQEASQDSYRNQLNGEVYRKGKKMMGDLNFNFTLGQYDYPTKADFLGGTASATSWKRARGAVDIHLCLIALTDDDQYCVLPYASIAAREATTDGAVGLPVVGSMVAPKETAIAPEYWFDKATVDAAS
jgi:hypothetical protein